MSSYYRIIFLIVFIFNGCMSAQPSYKSSDSKYDTMILIALDYELAKEFKNSSKIYIELYNLTNNKEYLNKAISHTMISKEYKTLKELCKNNLDKYPKLNERFYRLAIMASLQLKQIDEALELSKKLLKKYNNATNYEIVGNIYYAQGLYKEATQYFESAYATSKKAKVLISLVDILYVYLDEKQKAISYLETYLRLHGCQELVCNKLILFYREQQNIDGMISVMKTAVKEYKHTSTKQIVLSLLLDVLEKKDINKAIKFLEENRVDDAKLLILYERSKKYKKALTLIRKSYKKTKNKELLGKIAILEFEMADDKQSTIKHVIANFELALTISNNPNYKNYYGYLLIDYDIDVDKGLALVREALESMPNNLAYMDSVAWGYYKKKSCKKALKYMKDIVDQVGLDNEEIKLHWEKIQECEN